MKKSFHRLSIELTKGDITNQIDMDAIVNAANAELRTGGGVAGAIHMAGDPELEQLTRPFAPIVPGEAVITAAPGLPNQYVIHCLGPVYGRDHPSDKLLANCYRNALQRAEESNISSIAFPAISTGAFGYPMKEAAETAIQTIKTESKNLNSVNHVRFVLWDNEAFKIHKEVLETV